MQIIVLYARMKRYCINAKSKCRYYERAKVWLICQTKNDAKKIMADIKDIQDGNRDCPRSDEFSKYYFSLGYRIQPKDIEPISREDFCCTLNMVVTH